MLDHDPALPRDHPPRWWLHLGAGGFYSTPKSQSAMMTGMGMPMSQSNAPRMKCLLG
jgi:hypothetical protein